MRFGHKFGAKRTLYCGKWYHSKGEADYAAMLDVRKRVKDIQDWWGQIAYPLTVNGVTVAKLVVDFKVLHNDGSLELIEYKGFETEAWKLKHKLFTALYPEQRLTMVKAQDRAARP